MAQGLGFRVWAAKGCRHIVVGSNKEARKSYVGDRGRRQVAMIKDAYTHSNVYSHTYRSHIHIYTRIHAHIHVHTSQHGNQALNQSLLHLNPSAPAPTGKEQMRARARVCPHKVYQDTHTHTHHVKSKRVCCRVNTNYPRSTCDHLRNRMMRRCTHDEPVPYRTRPSMAATRG
jgi:hypothetical protein